MAVILLPRYLGDVNLGKLSVAIFLTTLASLLVDFGAASFVTREVARQRSQISVSALVFNGLAMRIPLILIGAGLSVAAGSLLGYDELTRKLIYLLLPAMALQVLFSPISAVLQGLQDLRPVAIADATGKILFAGVLGLVLVSGYGLLTVAAVMSVTGIVSVGLAGTALFRRVGFQPHLDLKIWRGILHGGMPFFVWQASLFVYGQIDILQLSLMTSDAVVGWYAAAYRIISFVGFVPVIITAALYPAFSAVAVRNVETLAGMVRRSTELVFVATLPIALGLAVLSPKIVSTLGYGSEFDNSVPLIAILAVHMPVVGITMILGSALMALDRQRRWALIGVAAAVINPTLNFVLIPITDDAYGNGAIGAAAATLITETFMLLSALRLLRPHAPGQASVFFLLRALAAGGIMLSAVWLVRDGSPLVSIPVGAVVYGATSLALGTIRFDDWREMYGNLRKRASTTPSADRERPQG